jgi:hypothetical protein
MANTVTTYTSPSDYEISDLYARAFGPGYRDQFMRRWKWEFELGPAVARFGNLVTHRDGKAIAHLGRVPARLAIGGTIVPAAFTSDLMADPEHGGLAVLGLAARTLKEVPVVLHFGGQPAAKRIFERLGMTAVPVGAVLVRVQRPGGALALLASRFLRRRAPGLAGLVRRWMFTIPGLFVAPFVMARYRGRDRVASGRLRVEAVSHFDQRFDALGAAMRRQQPVMCLRDGAFLEWRYRNAPSGHYPALAATEPNGGIRAMAVLTRVESGLGSYGKFMDVLYRDEEALSEIVDASLKEFDRMGVDIVVSIGLSDRIRSELRVVGFRTIARTRPFLFKCNLGAADTAVLRDAGNWYLAPGDGDEDLEETVNGIAVV